MARGGQVVFITDPEGERHAPPGARVVVTAPRCDPLIAPLVMAAPIQLLAYHVAVQKGRGRRPAAQPGQVGDGGVILPHRGRGTAKRWRGLQSAPQTAGGFNPLSQLC